MRCRVIFVFLAAVMILGSCYSSSMSDSESKSSVTENARVTCEDYTATNVEHVAKGRAEVYLVWGFIKKARTVGGGDDLGSLGSDWFPVTTTVYKVSDGVYKKGECTQDFSTDADLSTLSIQNVAISPAFSPDVTEYSASVSYEVTSIVFDIAVSEPNASYIIDGNVNDLVFGENIFSIIVTAEAGNTKTYTVTVNRDDNGLSTNANLSLLAVGGVALSPVFSPDTIKYSAVVANDVTSVVLAVDVADAGASYVIEGNTGSLSVGDNIIDIIVTAEAGNTKTYTITITRKSSGTEGLSDFASVGGSTEGIAFDGKGNMYVTVSNQGKIVKIDASGTQIETIASGLTYPEAIAFDPDGNLWLAEFGTQYGSDGKVKKFTPDGTLLKTFTKYGTGYFDVIKGANGLTVGRDGTVYVTDLPGKKVIKIDKNDTVSVLFSDSTGNGPNGLTVGGIEGNILYVVQMEQTSYFKSKVGYINKIMLDENGDRASVTKITPTISMPFMDGITTDPNGMLYVSYNQKDIARVNPDTGQTEVIYESPSKETGLSWPANIAFGKGPGFDSRYLYITQVGISVGEPATDENKKVKKLYVDYGTVIE